MEYAFTLTGRMPLLMHADDVEAADELKTWRKSKDNKAASVAGDDRSPPWTWQTYLYHDQEHLVIPQGNIMKCLGKAATRIPKREGRGTYKEVSQSGLLIPDENCRFFSRGKPVSYPDVVKLAGLPFADQAKGVQKLGFDLLVKRATVGQAKHVRVRARFQSWSIQGRIMILDPVISEDVLMDIFDEAGKRVGLLDWRPSSPKSPGPYGTFTHELKLITVSRKSA